MFGHIHRMKQFHPLKCIKILNEKVRELIGKLEGNPDEKGISWKVLVGGKTEENRRMEMFQMVLIKAEIIQFERKCNRIAFHGFWILRVCGSRGWNIGSNASAEVSS